MKKTTIVINIILVIFTINLTKVHAYDNVSDTKTEEIMNNDNYIYNLNDSKDMENQEIDNLKSDLYNFSVEEINIIEESVQKIENELLKNGIDVLTEIEKQIQFYENLLDSEIDDDKVNQILNIIGNLEYISNEFREEKMALNMSFSVETNNITTSSIALIASIMAYFNSNGWTLASELLSHMYTNPVVDSIYRPVNATIVNQSPVFQGIVNGDVKYGFSNFTNDGTQIGGDLYYSIHAFRYTKSDSNRTVVITDRYDFALAGYDTIAGIAVYALTTLQNQGVLKPFYTIIERPITNLLVQPNTENIPQMNSYSKLVEKRVTLGSGEYKDYFVSFNTSGTKTFQTFGYNDSVLELYNASGNKIASDDDSGYGLNSSISCNVLANVQYRIRVKFWSSSKYGEIKLAITPSSITNYDNIPSITFQGWWIFGSIYTIVNTQANYVDFYTYTPSEDGFWHIRTTKEGSTYLDTYLYVLDPRTTFLTSETMPYNLNKYNDDSGSNLQASFLLYYPKNYPILIIASTYNVATTGKFKIEISKFSMSV